MRHVTLAISEPEASPDQLEELSLALRQELLETDVESVVRLSTGDAPAGARAPDAAAVGALLVALAAKAGAVTQLVQVIRTWLRRGPTTRGVELTVDGKTLKLGRATEDEQNQLVEAFIRSLAPERP
jgi:hypothetical protein